MSVKFPFFGGGFGGGGSTDFIFMGARIFLLNDFFFGLTVFGADNPFGLAQIWPGKRGHYERGLFIRQQPCTHHSVHALAGQDSAILNGGLSQCRGGPTHAPENPDSCNVEIGNRK